MSHLNEKKKLKRKKKQLTITNRNDDIHPFPIANLLLHLIKWIDEQAK